MMNYKVYKEDIIDVGFEISSNEILTAAKVSNDFLLSLPNGLFKSIDFKTTGAMIGAIFCSNIAESTSGCALNPIEKGYPDLIPARGISSTEEELRNYPFGLEVKGTIGNVKSGLKLKAGESRIHALSAITWQAHHREVNNLLGVIWDFANTVGGFNYPAITGAFFSAKLCSNDWGEISGTTGRNTKVTGMTKSGKDKMRDGVLFIYDNQLYIRKYLDML